MRTLKNSETQIISGGVLLIAPAVAGLAMGYGLQRFTCASSESIMFGAGPLAGAAAGLLQVCALGSNYRNPFNFAFAGIMGTAMGMFFSGMGAIAAFQLNPDLASACEQ